jgi:DnaJ-class molecular chaperone
MQKVNLEIVPHHMRKDYSIRNENIDKGIDLCPRCSGTGNELVSMYRKCHACNGTGEKSLTWNYTKESN